MTENCCWTEQLEAAKEEIGHIYDAFQDEISRALYKNLMLLQHTENLEYLVEAVRLSGFEPDPALVQRKMLLKEASYNRH